MKARLTLPSRAKHDDANEDSRQHSGRGGGRDERPSQRDERGAGARGEQPRSGQRGEREERARRGGEDDAEGHGSRRREEQPSSSRRDKDKDRVEEVDRSKRRRTEGEERRCAGGSCVLPTAPG